MKKIFISHKLSIVNCAALLFFVLLAVWVLGLLLNLTRPRAEELFITPFLADAKGWELYTVEMGRRRELSTEDVFAMESGKVFYLSRLLTKEQEDAGYTFLLLDMTRPCAVFIDGELFYTNCPGDDMHIDAVSFPQDYTVTVSTPGESVRCTLPAHYAGRTLTVATAYIRPESGTGMPGITLSSYAAASDSLITGISRKLMPAAGFAVLALILSGIWLFALFQGIRDDPSLLLILAALIQMFSHLRQFTFISPISYAMDSPLAAFIPYIEVMLPCVWLLLQIKERKNRLIFGAVLGISAAVSLILPIGGLFGGLPFHSSFLEKRAILFCPLAALLFVAIREILRNRNLTFTLLLSGLGITVCLIAALYVGSLCGEGYYASQIADVFIEIGSPTINSFFYWCAMVLFTLSTILALYQIIRRITGLRTDLALQTEHARQLDAQLSAQKDFYEARLSHETQLRSMRHDMAGHLNTLAILLGENKPEEALRYLSGLTDYHKEQVSAIYSKNPYMNAVLQNYAAKCSEHHIAFICHIGSAEQELPATELCLILNNALENAVEGSMKTAEADRVIKVQTAIQQGQFLLRVSNRFDGRLTAADDLPVSTKAGREHGYGLYNIRQAAMRRGGQMEYRVQDGYFVLDVSFPVVRPAKA